MNAARSRVGLLREVDVKSTYAPRLDAVMVRLFLVRKTEVTQTVICRWFVHFSCSLQVNFAGRRVLLGIGQRVPLRSVELSISASEPVHPASRVLAFTSDRRGVHDPAPEGSQYDIRLSCRRHYPGSRGFLRVLLVMLLLGRRCCLRLRGTLSDRLLSAKQTCQYHRDG